MSYISRYPVVYRVSGMSRAFYPVSSILLSSIPISQPKVVSVSHIPLPLSGAKVLCLRSVCSALCGGGLVLPPQPSVS